jgi:large subunit ribosomal protein L6
MSRIGKQPVSIPKGVTFTYSNHKVSVKGPKGELHQNIDPDFVIKQEEGNVVVERPTDQKRHKAMHGLYRALIANMMEGVSKGYKHQLELVGVGYKQLHNQMCLSLALDIHTTFSSLYPLKLKFRRSRRKDRILRSCLEGIDKQLIGQIAAKLKSLRKIEPYKGKGIKFSGEYVRRKAGKAAAK